MDNLLYFISMFPHNLELFFNSLDTRTKELITEIRLRRNKPIIVYINNKCFFFDITGKLCKNHSIDSIKLNDNDFDYICDRLCNNSYHTNMSTMINGYITTKNGSRIGVSSSAVYKNNEIYSVKDISSINIRIAQDHLNCSKNIIDIINSKELKNIIVASAPGCGKTTFLRDYARLVSNGYLNEYKKVSIIDERNEICADFDVGINTDILINFPKTKGIEIATRTLSPDLIVCDEIGSENELNAISSAFSNGVHFAVSVHLKDSKSIESNRIIQGLINTNMFDYIIILKHYTYDFEIIELSEMPNEACRNYNDYPFYFIN